MYIKIYFGTKPLFLCDAVDNFIEPYLHHDDTVLIDELDIHSIKTMLHEMQQEKVHAGVFLHPDLGELKKAFYKKFTLIQAGGGLVENSSGEWLLIHRRGSWDLPKGKLDKGETMEECALREVREETGLKSVSIDAPLIITWHTYHEGTRFILKESHWFKMRVTTTDPLIPQAEEDITEVKWVQQSAIESYLPSVYPSVADVLLTAGSN